MGESSKDIEFMQEALKLAKKGRFSAAPNPMVGAILTHKDTIIGSGFHNSPGSSHAEVHAIGSVLDSSLLPESTLYVTLEPCCHFGRTPPCTELIISSGIKKVIVGCLDPFPKVRGKGISKLKEAGVEVSLSLLEPECLELNKRFITFHTDKRPYVILKWAQTKDGFIARPDYSSKWISSEKARKIAHTWRAEECSVLIGTNTARYDNPILNVRNPSDSDALGHNPVRIVIDKKLSLPPDLNLFDSNIPTLVFTESSSQKSQPNLEFIKTEFSDNLVTKIMDELYFRNIISVLVEGGSNMINSFIDKGIWDEARVITSPITFGSGILAPKLRTDGEIVEQIDRQIDGQREEHSVTTPTISIDSDTLGIFRNYIMRPI